MANALVLNAAELLRRPGTERDVELDVQPDELDIDDPRLVPGAPVQGGLHLESLGDGIVVTGTVVAAWTGTCRRCLGPATGTSTVDVHELYQHTVTDPDAFELIGDQLDLRPMVRELVLLELPDAPVCRDDCAGLCPTCGVDRNAAACSCTSSATDPRWDALADLRIDLDSNSRRAAVAVRRDRSYPDLPISSETAQTRSAGPNHRESRWLSQEEEVQVEDAEPPGRRLEARRPLAQRVPALCAAAKLPHTVCPSCGWYKDRVAVDVS